MRGGTPHVVGELASWCTLIVRELSPHSTKPDGKRHWRHENSYHEVDLTTEVYKPPPNSPQSNLVPYAYKHRDRA
ncbi:hypothetical protein Lesp02_02540 [Lentzea sp. NBRC 105346]|nr:hypothetical protein Lesp02_02540 [Lentzea sp. NBRC 105346]